MTDSTKYEDLCSALLDGELSREERRSFEAQLQDDPDCAAYMEDLRFIKEAWHSLEEPGPLTMHEDIMAKITAEAQRNVIPLEKKRHHIPVFTMLAGAVACVLLVGTGTLGNWFGGAGSAAPEQEAAAVGYAAEEALPQARDLPTGGGEAVLLDGSAAIPMEPDPESDNMLSARLEQELTEQIELPESIRQQSFAACYMAVGAGELPVMDGVTLLEEGREAAFFKLENNMNRLESITATLAQSDYQMILREDMGVRLDETAADVLLIIKRT